MWTIKVFWLAIMASYLATCALGPASTVSHLNLRWLSPMRFDSIDESKRSMKGADLMAGICLYTCAFQAGLWIPCLAFAAFDAAYYGPMGLAMPTAAAAAVLTLF